MPNLASVAKILPGFPAVPPVRLARTPLKTMLCQAKFPVRSEFAAPVAPSKIHEILARRLPRLVQEPQATLVVAGSGVQAQSSTIWRLTTFDQTWSVLLAQDAVTVETTAYVDWADFRARFAETLDAVNQVVQLSARERIGLRYVNEIRAGANPNWVDYINRDLLGWTADLALTQDLALHVSEARFAVDEYLAILRYGVVRQVIPSTEAAPPFFLLDIDCADNRPAPFDLEASLEMVDRFNEAIWRVFRWSLAENYFKQLQEPK